MITVGQIKNGVLHEMREYSNSGSIQGESDIKDYLLSIVPLINLYQKELATSTNKIKRKFEIAHNMPVNQLGLINWNEENYHAGGQDKEFIAIGARAYSLQIAGRSTVYIKEETAPDVWETLKTITQTPTDGDGYVTYKGLTGISDISHRLKIVFSGDYSYPFRWIGMFSENFYSDSEVPTFEPYVPYDLPSNFYSLDRVEWTHADRQKTGYAAYKFDDTQQRKIFINWYEKGEFSVYHNAYPTLIAEPSATNINEKDSVELDIADECLPTLVHRIAATLLRDENAYMADTLENFSQISKAELIGNNQYEQGQSGIVTNSNW